MTSNATHRYFRRETYLKERYFTEEDRRSCEVLEAHREAFLNRMEFSYLFTKHDGEEDFPYDEFDLAKYLHSLCDD